MDYTKESLMIALFGGAVGMLTHIIKKKVRGESATAIMRYFTNHVGYTITAFGAMLGAIAAIYDPSMNIFKLFGACLTAGYASDSMFNKDADK
tara:strand:- start:1262 stop:1540 length:279 start_codon:yes stop_codon:yes gene_type:complete